MGNLLTSGQWNTKVFSQRITAIKVDHDTVSIRLENNEVLEIVATGEYLDFGGMQVDLATPQEWDFDGQLDR